MNKYQVGDRVIRVETGQFFIVVEVQKDDKSLLQQSITYKLLGPHPSLDIVVSRREMDSLFQLVMEGRKNDYAIPIKELLVQSNDMSCQASSRTCLLAANSLKTYQQLATLLGQIEFFRDNTPEDSKREVYDTVINRLKDLLPTA